MTDGLRLVRELGEATLGRGAVSYPAYLDGRWVGWVHDGRDFDGAHYGDGRWYAAWREAGDTAARANTTDQPMKNRREAIA